jgi:hypothetical protein
VAHVHLPKLIQLPKPKPIQTYPSRASAALARSGYNILARTLPAPSLPSVLSDSDSVLPLSVVEWHDSRPNGKFVVVAPRAAVRRRAVDVAPVGKLVDVATRTAVAAPARSWRSSISLPLRRAPRRPRRQR